MTINYQSLQNAPRLLMEAELKPLQGDRFQPTGFPDLGPARYTAPDGTEKLLVESPQSVANRMELVCWDETNKDLIDQLKGLPYIRVVDEKGELVTTSLLESHRINSPYILESDDKSVFNKLKEELVSLEDKPVDLRALARTLFKYDASAVLHGVFLAKSDLAGGRLRLARVLSGFIEASQVMPAESGGAKIDRVNPQGDTNKGFGNVIYHRTEFTAADIRAFFNMDLALLHSYGFPEDAEKLLLALALFKIRRFLSSGLRLRTACDLEVKGDIRVTRPQNGFSVPNENDLLAECQEWIRRCRDARLFAEPPVTQVKWMNKPITRSSGTRA